MFHYLTLFLLTYFSLDASETPSHDQVSNLGPQISVSSPRCLVFTGVMPFQVIRQEALAFTPAASQLV